MHTWYSIVKYEEGHSRQYCELERWGAKFKHLQRSDQVLLLNIRTFFLLSFLKAALLLRAFLHISIEIPKNNTLVWYFLQVSYDCPCISILCTACKINRNILCSILCRRALGCKALYANIEIKGRSCNCSFDNYKVCCRSH